MNIISSCIPKHVNSCFTENGLFSDNDPKETAEFPETEPSSAHLKFFFLWV